MLKLRVRNAGQGLAAVQATTPGCPHKPRTLTGLPVDFLGAANFAAFLIV